MKSARLFLILILSSLGLQAATKNCELILGQNPIEFLPAGIEYIDNQGSTGNCWLIAHLKQLQYGIHAKTREMPPLSAAFLLDAYYREYLLDRAHRYIFTPENSKYKILLEDGGYPWLALYLVKKYGLMLENAWEPSIPVPEWSLHDEVNKRVSDAEWNSTIAGIFNHPNRECIDCENEGLQKKRQEYENLIEQMDDIMTPYTGEIPKKVEFLGESLSPKEFAAKYAPQSLLPHRYLIPGKAGRPLSIRKLLSEDDQDTHSFLYRILKSMISKGDLRIEGHSLNVIENEVASSVDAGQTVTATFFWRNEDVEPFTGRLVEAKSTSNSQEEAEPHGILILKAVRGAGGKVTHWILQNSHGHSEKNPGVLVMGSKYFRKYLQYVLLPMRP